MNSFSAYKYYLKSDLARYLNGAEPRFRHLLRAYVTPGFRYTFWLRTCQWAKQGKHPLLFLVARFFHWIYSIRFGIVIPYQTQVGRGLYIAHYTCIFVSPLAKIGENCNLSQGVTIGQKMGGGNFYAPQIGDRVYIAPGAKVIGRVTVGDDAVIGANAVVTHDVPPRGVAAGIPARILSEKGSMEYVGSFYSPKK